MAKRFPSIEASQREFIERQRIFFVASAAREGRVNLSPKDGAALRLLGANRAAYLDVTGSGNETAAHIRKDGRVTLMFCAFEGAPMILRLYGRGTVLARGSKAYQEMLAASFDGEERPGARQIVVVDVDLVQTSCGYGVPLFEYSGERTTLTRWAEAKNEEQLRAYWREKNSRSIDGFPTGMLEANESPELSS